MPFKLLLAALALAAGAAAAPAAAHADSVSCRVGYYIPGADTASPTVTNLRAHDLPRRTDGYAPRCLVAEAIAGRIQDRFAERGSLPARVRVYGARWNGGRWRWLRWRSTDQQWVDRPHIVRMLMERMRDARRS